MFEKPLEIHTIEPSALERADNSIGNGWLALQGGVLVAEHSRRSARKWCLVSVLA